MSTDNTQPPSIHPPKIIGPVLLITIGLILLANNFGLIGWGIWLKLWQFWPLILVLGGLQLILGRNWFTRILSTIIVISVIIGVIFYALAQDHPNLKRFIPNWLPNQIFQK